MPKYPSAFDGDLYGSDGTTLNAFNDDLLAKLGGLEGDRVPPFSAGPICLETFAASLANSALQRGKLEAASASSLRAVEPRELERKRRVSADQQTRADLAKQIRKLRRQQKRATVDKRSCALALTVGGKARQ